MGKLLSSQNKIQVRVSTGTGQEEHLHQEVELFYVLDGKIELKDEEQIHSLQKGDMAVVNMSRCHAWHECSEAVVGRILISHRIFQEFLQKDYVFFRCNSADERGEEYQELGVIIQKILLEHLNDEQELSLKKQSLYYHLLDYLVTCFNCETADGMYGKQTAADAQLNQVISYIHRHYADKVSLNEIADRLYLSSSALSRFFKKATGEGFHSYVNRVKLLYAVEDLLHTDYPITRIAVENGFGNPASFNRVFRETYDMSPSSYKNMMQRDEQEKEQPPGEEERGRLRQFIRDSLPVRSADEVRSVKSDLTEKLILKKNIANIVNAGNAYLLLEASMQEHLCTLRKQLRFSYVRIWNIFSSQFRIFRETTYERLNFDKLDAVFDFLHQHHMKPMLELGFRPDMAIKSNEEVVFKDYNYTILKNGQEWQHMLKEFLLHIIRKYGVDEVETWMFEVPFNVQEKSFLEEQPYEYLPFFYNSYEVIRKYLPQARFGGPGAVPEKDWGTLKRILADWRAHEVEIDFITMLGFPYYPVRDKGRNIRTRVVKEPEFLKRCLREVRGLQEEFGYADTELIVSEWNESLSNRNYIHDSCARGTSIVRMLSDVSEYADQICFWYASDLLTAYYDSSKILYGGAGLITKNGILKPSFYAWQFFNRMGRYYVKKGDGYIITANNDKDFYILCYNDKQYSYKYYLQEDGECDLEDLEDMFCDRQAVTLEFELENIASYETYTIKKRYVNRQFGSILDEWGNFSHAEDLSTEDINYLRQICIPKVSISRKGVDQNLIFGADLQPHEMALYHIYC